MGVGGVGGEMQEALQHSPPPRALIQVLFSERAVAFLFSRFVYSTHRHTLSTRDAEENVLAMSP